jgi:hypothetical protein
MEEQNYIPALLLEVLYLSLAISTRVQRRLTSLASPGRYCPRSWDTFRYQARAEMGWPSSILRCLYDETVVWGGVGLGFEFTLPSPAFVCFGHSY